MGLKIEKTALDGVLLITPPTVFQDHRGLYVETYNESLYSALGVKFIQDDVSVSSRGVLRGIHGDSKTWKLISCFAGELFLVVVNNRTQSEQYFHWHGWKINQPRPQLLVPPMFGVGYQAISDKATFGYKQSTYYGNHEQFTIAWDDPKLKIRWPIMPPILSERDKRYGSQYIESRNQRRLCAPCATCGEGEHTQMHGYGSDVAEYLNLHKRVLHRYEPASQSEWVMGIFA